MAGPHQYTPPPTLPTAAAEPDNVAEEDPWSEAKLKEAILLWKLSDAEQKKLRALQVQLQDVHHEWNDPHIVLGFALSGGFASTERRFRKMIRWRLKNKVDCLLTTYQPNPLLLDQSCMAMLNDYDRDGDPIYVERGGAIDAKGLLKRFSREALMQHAVWLREVLCDGEWIEDYGRRRGRPVCTVTVVYDLKGLSPHHLNPVVLGFFQQLMDITEKYYPSPIKRMIIIRSPKIFQVAWNGVIKHFFSKTSREKMIFAGEDYLGVLSQYLDVAVLPPCVNPQGTGETARGMPKRLEGGKIPSHVGLGGAGYVTNDSGISGAPSGETYFSAEGQGSIRADEANARVTKEESIPAVSEIISVSKEQATLVSAPVR